MCVRVCRHALQEKQPVICHRDGNMHKGVVYSVLKDGLQFLAVVSTSNAVPGTHAASHGTLDYFRSVRGSRGGSTRCWGDGCGWGRGGGFEGAAQ